MTEPSSGRAAEPAVPFEFQENDSVVIIGNTFAERMRLSGYFEMFLHSKFPEHRLRIRNLGWSGDEVALRPRPKGFEDLHRHLTREKADVIFACFGMNESFHGTAGLSNFERDLNAFIDDLQAQEYNGQTAPRIVLVSPIAYERVHQHLPEDTERNRNLESYGNVMANVAEKQNVRFIDLFSPTRDWTQSSPKFDLTFNGIHLTAPGYWKVSLFMAQSLGLIGETKTFADIDPAPNERLRTVIYDKNYSFFFHWRPPNMEYLHGGRNRLPGAEGMPEELQQIDKIVEQLDRRIWRMKKPSSEEIWRYFPTEKTMWSPPPRYTGIRIPEIGEVVRRGGDEEEGRGDVLTPREALKKFRLPPGYAINLFASEQDLPIANPVAIHFDAEGRLWVANSPTWPHPLPGVPPADSIVILEDFDKDGIADNHHVFLDGLDMIHGFILGNGGAYVAQTPNLIFAEDTNADWRADRIETVMHGFGGEDVEHSINNFQWGPDGAMYFMEGIFFHTQVETPYGPRRLKNSGVFRYQPLTERVDVFVSYAFWNPWGQVFDRWGQSIVLDASSHDYFNMDVLSANFVYPKAKQNKHQTLSFAPDDVGPAAGIDLVTSRHFPDEAQGRFLANQLSGGFRGIRWYEVAENGTSYDLTRLEQELLVSDDPFFRPLAMTFGPDGALYIADFYSALIENTSQPKRKLGRDHIHGRIWRITYPARELLDHPQVSNQSIPELLDLLKAHESSTRNHARRKLHEQSANKVVPQLQEWARTLDAADAEFERNLLEALWVYQGLDVIEPVLLKQLLGARDHRVRASAVRVLRFWQNQIDDSIGLLKELVEDEHPRVRLQAVLACGFNSSEQARTTALQVTRRPMDAGLKNALDDTMDYFDRLTTGPN